MTVFKIQGENRSVFGPDEHFHRNWRSNVCKPFDVEEVKKKAIHRFRCLDGDGITYFWGISTKEDFVPLDDVGEAYGCVEIQYKNENGKYETL